MLKQQEIKQKQNQIQKNPQKKLKAFAEPKMTGKPTLFVLLFYFFVVEI